mgnify:CR=1 FL=1|tara:strand:- start:349 stop:525 length:177 start_codon:yes stop_codon:yes gene_type:complete
MSCLKVDIDGVITDITPQTFRFYSFVDAKIISGDKYYVDKAVKLGAKPKRKPRAKKAD